jgi:hypothetical protein
VATPSRNLASAEQRLQALRRQRSQARASHALHDDTLDRQLFEAEAAVISASKHAGDQPRRLTEGLDQVRTERVTMTQTRPVYDGEEAWIDRREQQWQRALRNANRPRTGFVGWLFGRNHAA